MVPGAGGSLPDYMRCGQPLRHTENMGFLLQYIHLEGVLGTVGLVAGACHSGLYDDVAVVKCYRMFMIRPSLTVTCLRDMK